MSSKKCDGLESISAEILLKGRSLEFIAQGNHNKGTSPKLAFKFVEPSAAKIVYFPALKDNARSYQGPQDTLESEVLCGTF